MFNKDKLFNYTINKRNNYYYHNCYNIMIEAVASQYPNEIAIIDADGIEFFYIVYNIYYYHYSRLSRK